MRTLTAGEFIKPSCYNRCLFTRFCNFYNQHRPWRASVPTRPAFNNRHFGYLSPATTGCGYRPLRPVGYRTTLSERG
ncbi:MAG: hypothetical protein N2255_05135 [Kiritimatiellae bacterium]|nr:hypothetical protein [Kiritimatiellia bacterium]